MSGPAARDDVVVAVDHAGTAVDAVEWASAEAAAQRCRLRIVHASHPPVVDPYCVVAAADGPTAECAAGELLLRKATARARAVAPDIEITTAALRGTPGHALLDQAAGARLLVVGSRRRSGLRGLLTRSVSIQLAAHAPCPVVVVRQTTLADEPGWSPPRVVVGVDATESPAALGFAFRAARQRGLPLFAVRAWTPDRPADLEGVSGAMALAELLARRTLGRALSRWHDEFPDVPVHATLVRGDPAHALITHSHRAALLVIGTRGRGHVAGTMLGSVSQTVLQHGHGPVAIINAASTRHAEPLADRDPGPGRDTHGDRRWSA